MQQDPAPAMPLVLVFQIRSCGWLPTGFTLLLMFVPFGCATGKHVNALLQDLSASHSFCKD